MKNEVCACGSKDIEIWKRQRVGKGKAGQYCWFAHCPECGHRVEGSKRSEVSGLMRDRVRPVLGAEWSEEDEDYVRLPAL